MKKYFKYELKKALLPTLIMTAIACIIYVTSVLNSSFIGKNFETGAEYPYEPPTVVITAILIGLCVCVPILTFSFKMNSKQVDCMYSIPLKREKVYLVKSIAGLFQVLVPYTVAFWLGFIATALKPNLYVLWAYVPLFFASIPLAIAMFGINSFTFTRANRIVDGAFFMVLFGFIAYLFVGFIVHFVRMGNYVGYFFDFSSFFIVYAPVSFLTSHFNYIIASRALLVNNIWVTFLFAFIYGTASWLGLFLTVKKEKAENTERVSDSLFGYRTLIPFYEVCLLAIITTFYEEPVLAVLTICAAFTGYVIFRRTVRLKKEDLIVLASASVLGLLLNLIQLFFTA